jgi:hypothetical protein
VADARINTLVTRGDKLFGDKAGLDSLHQQIAEHFYVERADFTRAIVPGDDFAGHLYSSYPLLVRRELGDAIGGMLRPKNMPWFEMTAEDGDRLSSDSKRWLQWATEVQRRWMYDRKSQFSRATKQADHDFASFGQAVIQRYWDVRERRMLYKTWHLRDCAWAESYDGSIGEIHRKWTPTCADLAGLFKDLHPNVTKALKRSPFTKIACRAVVLRAEDYESPVGKKWRTPWVHVYIDVENKHVLEESGMWAHGYTIPRWVTVSGSPYAYSPAAIAGLPEARLIQAMTLTLLEAGEMAVRPPLVATKDAIREDVQWYPGGITWADGEYNDKKHDVLRPITQDKSGIPFGMDFATDSRSMLAAIFYLNKLTMPLGDGQEKTAFEVGQLVQQYIRQALPLFEPIEDEYNATICEDTFEGLARVGAFGAPQTWPRELRGRDIQFQFESPLHDAEERKKATTFLEMKSLVKEAFELDSAALQVPKATEALAEALAGLGFEEKFIRDADEVAELTAQVREREHAAMALQMAEQGASAVEKLGKASQALAPA